jgi:hypothetical protein
MVLKHRGNLIFLIYLVSGAVQNVMSPLGEKCTYSFLPGPLFSSKFLIQHSTWIILTQEYMSSGVYKVLNFVYFCFYLLLCSSTIYHRTTTATTTMVKTQSFEISNRNGTITQEYEQALENLKLVIKTGT